MTLQDLYRTIEKTMAAVAFAEAGELEKAEKMAFPEAELKCRKRPENQAERDNRPVLHC